ncbi:MAG: translation initiation factor IF-3, partial [Chitinivibrionales bacterium]|nr:translation initiation factor IF-3 [Chitinivibrionales bacterium]
MQRRRSFAKKEDVARINHRIRAPQVRLISEGGEQVGVVPVSQAIQRALDAELDLVEIAPNANPPVCKIMDYGK